DGLITMEFPHLLQLTQNNQFDTIYHEHFSYFSFLTVQRIFEEHGLTLIDVETLPTHGGSLRIYAMHSDQSSKRLSPRVKGMCAHEIDHGFDKMETYLKFGEQVKQTKRLLLKFLIDAKENGKSIVGYGAPAKGNTLLNYCGVGNDFIDYTVDRSPHKQNHLLPGTHIPVFSPDKIKETKPDLLLILPWNLKDEIMEQMSFIREWGGAFLVLIPEPVIIP
ncbi:MAG: SAM-dependent methyltransferase, partial [Rhodospirillaceae bacterium]|nr:SAM-dependent methyltransferase [Rhodospirillaceae bacterium]